MCGIAGILDRSGAPIPEHTILEMNRKVAHRGPDGSGLFFDKALALGHQRLAIIDLSESAAQPMTSAAGHTIVFNGEIYNYIELRAKLKSHGYHFRSTGDTEVLLAAYDHWGPSCVEQFNGMWAFAIYDPGRNTIFCSRDRFGIKPFYYLLTDKLFAFGSEVPQLLDLKPKRSVDTTALMDYLVIGLEDHSSRTFFRDVTALSPSTSLIFDIEKSTLSITRYYELVANADLRHLDEHKAIDMVRDMLSNSTAFRLRSDVKVGTCLSGGVDSSAVAAFAAHQLRGEDRDARFAAVTAISGDPLNDESEFASAVASHCGLEPHTANIDKFGMEDLATVVRTQGEPFPSPSILLQYQVYKRAREVGCKVMLDGQGGDETFIGYERYYPTYIFGEGVRGILKAFQRTTKRSKLSAASLLSYMFYFRVPKFRVAVLKVRRRNMKSEYLDAVQWENVARIARSYKALDSLQIGEICHGQLSHLLKYADRNSMAHGVESRLPLIDYRLVEIAVSLPGSLKVKNGWSKYLLRKAMEPYLPNTVTWRTHKIGFEAAASSIDIVKNLPNPIDSSPILGKIFKTTDISNVSDLWKLHIFHIWEREFNVIA